MLICRKSFKSRSFKNPLSTVFRPQLQCLEDRCVPANTLFLAPNGPVSYALIGHAYSQDFEAYGPGPLDRGPYSYSSDTPNVDGLTFTSHDNIVTLSGTPTA